MAGACIKTDLANHRPGPVPACGGMASQIVTLACVKPASTQVVADPPILGYGDRPAASSLRGQPNRDTDMADTDLGHLATTSA